MAYVFVNAVIGLLSADVLTFFYYCFIHWGNHFGVMVLFDPQRARHMEHQETCP